MSHGTAWIGLAVLGCLCLVAAGAQAAEDPEVHPLTTAGEDPVPAGVPTTVGWVLTNGDGQPAFHQDATFEVTFENRTLLSTTPASGHDYDGVDPYRVAFPEPGNYTVRATVDDDSTGETEKRTVTYTGQVGPAPEADLRVSLDVPDRLRTSEQGEITAEVTGPDGEPVDHAEVTVRVRRAFDAFEVFKTRLTVEDGQASLSYAFERSGTFQVLATAAPIPGKSDPTLGPGAARGTISVEEVPTEASTPGAPVERPLLNARETGEEGEGYELFGTYDPYTSVGPHGRVRLGMLTLEEATGAPAGDVDYRATLTGPDDRQLFHSTDLRAEDGFEYVTVSRPELGTYQMRVDATKGDWSDHVVLEFTVLAPAAATNAGALHASPNASGPLEAGQPTTFPIQVDDAAGVPLTHGEVDVRLVDADTHVPVYSGKLHAHENGTLPITLAPPEAGDYRLEIMPESLQPAPTPFTFGEQVGQAPVFDVTAEPAAPGDEVLEPQADEPGPEEDEVPGPGLLVLASLLAAVALARRRV